LRNGRELAGNLSTSIMMMTSYFLVMTLGSKFRSVSLYFNIIIIFLKLFALWSLSKIGIPTKLVIIVTNL
jgi:hypothetical protein